MSTSAPVRPELIFKLRIIQTTLRRMLYWRCMRGECFLGGACECCRCPSALESTSCTSTTKEGEANAIRRVPLLRAAALHFFPGAGAE